jgi:ligand-binding sensor domain-containing protein/signal transduction histidine kinase
MLLWLALLPLPGSALGPGRPLGEFGQQTWQSDSGLPQNTVRAILQARDGFLWLGTEAGLVRFDGIDFRVFDPSNTPAMQSGFIRSLAEDRAGTLWIGTADGLLAEHDGSFRRYGAAEGLPEPDVLAAHMLADGRLMTLSAAGAELLVKDRFQALPGTAAAGFTEGAASVIEDVHGNAWLLGSAEVFSLGTVSATAIATPEIGRVQALAPSLAGGDLWVGGSSGLVLIRGGIHDGRRTHFTTADGLPSNDVTALAATALGLWVGTGEGLAFIPAGGDPSAIEIQPELAGHRVQQLFPDLEGSVWVATAEGIARITNRHVEYVRRRPTLPGVLTMYEDRERSMWFGTDSSGLSVLREQAFSTLTTDDGLSAAVVRAVFEDHAGSVWIGTANGLDRYADERVTHFAGSLPSQVVLALAETRAGPAPGDPVLSGDDDLWVGTPAGLARIQNSQTVRTYTTADGLPDDFVRSLYADRDGTLWIGTRNGLAHFKDGRFRSWSKLDGLGSDLIGAMLRTRDGTLWVGTLGGLSYQQGDGFRTLPSAGVTALLADSGGTLWVATNGGGLARMQSGRTLRPVPTLAGLPRTIFGMLEDGSGNLWLSSRTGIDRVAITALTAFANDPSHPPAITHYGAADGMRIREASGGGHPAAWRAQDGALWFATLNGAAAAHPETAVRNTLPPPVAIEQVLVDGAAGDPAAPTIRVEPGHGRLTLQYAGLSFVAPGKVRYRYTLEGFDKHWIDAGTRRTAFYTNVPPGSYRFLVLAANNDGLWSARAAQVRFVIEPFYYQTAWFYALVALALAGSGYLIYYVRVRSVEAGYRAVLDERGRIAREIHDTLAQGYVAVTVQLELAERLLTSSSASAISAATDQLRATRALVRESLEEARSSIWNLRAQADAATLPAQLAETVRRYGQRSAASIKFAVHGTYRPLPALDPELQRIAQEALANAVTHARASAISVTLTYEAALLLLRVADDGLGVPPEPERPGHFGLQGMRERAARIHAILNIEPGPESKGTVVTLRVGIEAERKSS